MKAVLLKDSNRIDEAVSLIINRKIVERRISALEERIDSVEKGSARSRSVGPTRSSGPRR